MGTLPVAITRWVGGVLQGALPVAILGAHLICTKVAAHTISGLIRNFAPEVVPAGAGFAFLDHFICGVCVSANES